MRRICLRFLLLVALGASAALAQDFSSDQAASKALIQSFATTTGPRIQQQEFGNVDTSGAAALGSNTQSLSAHRTANIDRVNACKAKAEGNYAGVANQEKLDCQAVITAANITFAPNPYLDTTNPNATANAASAKSLLSAQKNAKSQVQSGAITSPLAFATKTDCAPQSTTTPAVSRLDTCRAEKPVTPTTCSIIVSSTLVDGKIVAHDDPAQCAPYAANPSCIPGGISCTLETDVDTGVKDASGNPVLSRVCAVKTQGYDCWSVNAPWDKSNCSVLGNDPACAPTGVTSPVQLVAGASVWEDIQYSCVMKPEQVAITNGCNTTTCVGGTCFDTTPQASQDFASMAVGMEMVREAGVYAHGDPANIRIFQGVANNCTRPTGIGIGANCCNASGAPLVHNRDVLPAIAWQAGSSVVGSAARYGIQQASTYMYDFMFTSGSEWMQEKAFEAMASGSWVPSGPDFGTSFGAYGFSMDIGVQSGFSVSSVLPSAIGEAYSAATVTIAETTIGGMNVSFTFNPYMLAAMVAWQVIQQMNSCSIDEKMLSARRGGNLCVKLGEHCSMQLPWPLKTCIQITEDWCCWDSRLAETIAVQGGAQLGGGPRCGGFSPDELTQIDFSKIDLSAFAAEMRASVVLPDTTYNASTASQSSLQAIRARNSVNPAQSAAGAASPDLGNYVQGRIGSMLQK
jgi:conjugal transfer mating pair stabilization protein TraN